MVDDRQTSGVDGPGVQVTGGVVEVELAQGLGLAEALAIGIGVMVGGIFVLPGLIIAEAGAGAILAFALGGLIALLAAMCASEVATGMPKSGGGYYFISRALGPLWGAVIGWGSWFGLIFATGFYMVGFAQYAAPLLHLPPTAIAVGMTVLLVGRKLVGAHVAGKAQNLIVIVVLAVMALFIGAGVLHADAAELLAQPLLPFGPTSLLIATATLFVVYCGFGEIASVAEEVRDPGRNLPRALLGSVLVVTVIYCAVIALCVALGGSEGADSSRLMADQAEQMLGPAGLVIISTGAILSMLSAANASIMSAARISFAMGRDRLIWDRLNQVHPRFRVPHLAILMTGALIIVCILIGNLQLLAEAAGLLHLLLYGLICVACIILRGARLEAYSPAYRVPLYPLVPLAATLGCLMLAFFIQPVVLISSLVIIAFALAHYYFFSRRQTNLRGAWPYFLRRGILQPALRRTEQWGAMEDEIPKAMLAVANPAHEPARLQMAAAMMGPVEGELLAVNVFVADMTDNPRDEMIARYYETIAQRERILQEKSELIRDAGARVTSHVPVAGSVFCGLLSAAEASGASLGFFGWPEFGDGYEGSLRLLAALDRNLRAHMLVLREGGAVPARDILALVDNSIHGDLALLCAARLTNTWEAQLSVAGVMPAETDAAARRQAEAALEQRIGDRARATARMVLADSSIEAAAAEAPFTDMIILGVPADTDNNLATTVDELAAVTGCSIVLVRAYGDLEAKPL